MPSLRERIEQTVRTTPMPYQIKGVKFLERNQGRGILGDDMGLGKTFQTIAYLAIHPEVRPAVIVCPATLKLHWQRELWHHARLESNVLEGRKNRRPDGDIWIFNYDILHYWIQALQKEQIGILIIDECQRIKTRSTQRTQAVRALGRRCQKIIALSGTPILNRPIEFFPTLQLVAKQEFTSYWEYAMRYCNPKRGWRGRGWDFSGASNLTELHDRVSPHMIRRMKTEVLKELPTKIRTVLPVEISNRKEYVHAATEFIDWLGKHRGKSAVERAKGAEALVKLGELKRLAAVGKLKAVTEWVEDWLADTEQKLILFTVHHAITDSLLQTFPKALRVDGTVPMLQRQQAVDSFQTDPRKRLFIGGIDSLGLGTTLTASSTVAFVELGWTPAEHDQAEDRVLRIGQTSDRVQAFYFIGQDTIEEEIVSLLDTKRNVVSQILDGQETGSVFNDLLQRLLKK